MPSTRSSRRRSEQIQFDTTENSRDSVFSLIEKTDPDKSIPFGRMSIISLLFILPLLFGGVHPPVYWGVYSIFFILAALSTKETLRSHHTIMLSRLFTALTAYILLQGLTYGLWPIAHPIFGSVSSIGSWDLYITSFASILAFGAATYYFIQLFETKHSTRSFAISLFPVSLLFFSLIALAHWFSDSGKLFWIFRPDTVVAGERARWPFVSPNNLAQFLILLLFPVIASFFIALEELTRLVLQIAHRRAVRIADLLQLPRVQTLILRIGLSGVSFLAGILTILASQSRAGWIGLAIGIALFLCGWFSFLQKWTTPLPNSQVTISKTPLLKYMIGLRKTLPIISGVCFLAFVIMFLEGRGKELVADRLNYGFVAAIDDLRWNLYKDTIPMIYDHFFFGVGLGNWDLNFGKYASPEMGNLNPVYAHSDPLQIFAEIGFIGFAIIAYLGAMFYKAAYQISRSAIDAKGAMFSFSLLCGTIGLLVSSGFDFPFRMPAIFLLLSLNVALILTSPFHNKV